MEKISRKAAHAKGLVRFYTGKPCKRGHDRERNVKTGACLGCLSHYAKEYASKYNDAALGLQHVAMSIHPDDIDAVQAFSELLRRARINGTPAPMVPREQDIPAVNIMISMMRPAAAPTPAPPAEDGRYAMWVRIHGKEIADQMMAQQP